MTLTQVINACGPPWRINGPLPNPPVYGLLQTAAAPAAGVSIVTDVDDQGIERWENGVYLYPYPPGPARVWAPYAPASERVSKSTGDTLTNPEFDPMVVYVPDTCTASNIPDQAAFKARARLVMEATQGFAIAHEFMTGSVLHLNPHLTDGNGTFPNGDTSTVPWEALALLDQEISRSGQLGLIHLSPAMMVVLSTYYWFDKASQVNRTANGNPVIPDAGYTGGGYPLGHTAPTGTQEWMYATGPIEIRLSEIFTMPDTLAEAMSRGTGGAGSTANSVTYRAERYALIDWDTHIQAAVLADRCQTTC